MDAEIKYLSAHLRQTHPRVSFRLLDDLAERAYSLARKQFPEGFTLPQLLEFVDDSKDIAKYVPALARTLDSDTLVEEVIYLHKSKDVTTDIEVLAKLLADGIRRFTNPDNHVVTTRNLDEGQTDFFTDQSLTKHLIHIAYSPIGTPPENQANRIVYVHLPNSTDQPDISQILFKDLLVDGLPHFGSFIPTLISPKPDRRVVALETLVFEEHFLKETYRWKRDETVISADPEDPRKVGSGPGLIEETDRWARNVLNRQVGFATSGGGASAFRIIALLKPLMRELPVDVFSGLSGGALVGAYFVGDQENGLDKAINLGPRFEKILPAMMISSKYIEQQVDKDLDYRQVGRTSINFCPVTTELQKGAPPLRQIIRRATLGQAVRASGALPVMFAPTYIENRLFTDGMAASIVPTEVVVDHGGDTVMACNCIPGPNRTNPFAGSLLGRLAYKMPMVNRYIDAFTWINFLTQNASSAYGRGSDVYFEFNPTNISTFEPGQWWRSKEIYADALKESEKIEIAIEALKEAWEEKTSV